MVGRLLSLVPIFSLVLAGCASVTPVSPKYELVERPALNELATANIGDTVIEKGVRYTYDAIDLVSPLSKAPGLYVGYDIPPQTLAAVYEDNKHIYYQANRIVLRDMLLGVVAGGGGICIERADPSNIKVYVQPGQCNLEAKPAPIVEFTTAAAETSPSFVQELIYNGRVGSFVKFMYREFANDLARSAFTQEVQYDLDEGSEIGFKDARIEIVAATNTELQYRVIQSFPDQD